MPHADFVADAPPVLTGETGRRDTPLPRSASAFCRAAFSTSRSWTCFSRAAIRGAFATSPPGARHSLRPRSQSVEIPKCRETLTRKSREGFDFPERYKATVCCVISKLDANLRVETFSLSVFTRSRNFVIMSSALHGRTQTQYKIRKEKSMGNRNRSRKETVRSHVVKGE